MIPYFRLRSNPKELEALSKVHQSASWANGEYIPLVEEKLKTLFKREHIVLTSNGSSALLVSLRALGIEDKEVIVPCVSTCFAITNAVISSGNIPVFCDIDQNDGNCSVSHVAQLVEQRNIRYMITANFAGNLSAVNEFKKMGLIIIEDACQSFYSSLHVLSQADILVFSFYPTKGINGIDGGALLMNDGDIAKKAAKCVYFNDQIQFEEALRYNFRFLNAHAAVLYSNLGNIQNVQDQLNRIAGRYKTVLNNKKGVSVLENASTGAFQRFVIHVDDAHRSKLTETFAKREITLSPFFGWNCKKEQQNTMMNASKIINNTFCLPYFEDLSEIEQNQIIEALEHVFT